MEKTYLFILDDSGKRKATFLLGVHGKTLEELQAKANTEYPGDSQLVGYGEEYFNNFAQGMNYVNGEFVPEPPYVPTQAEINAGKIAELKAELSATDYKCLKYVDGALSDEEYAEVRVYRAELRRRINELEGML